MEEEVYSSFCRICLDGGSIIRPLKIPCQCTGSMAYVHKDCLSTWRCHFHKAHEKHQKCAVCKTPYKWRETKKTNYWVVLSVFTSLGTTVLYYFLMVDGCLPNTHAIVLYYNRPLVTCVYQASVGALSMYCKTLSLVLFCNQGSNIRSNLCLSAGISVPVLAAYTVIFVMDITKLLLPVLLGMYFLIEWLCLFIYVLEE